VAEATPVMAAAVSTAVIVAEETMVGAGATTVGVAVIGVMGVTVTDGASDLDLAGRIGGDTRMRTATVQGGSLPILILMIVPQAIHVLTMETTIRRRQSQIQNPRTTLRNPGDLPCRKGLPTRIMTAMPWWLLRRVLRSS
jgi:hypothetical protein